MLGLLVVDGATAEQWIGAPPRPLALFPGVPAALPRNAALLAGFGSMYFAVTSMFDTENRRRFFTPILDEVERTLAVRAVYFAARTRCRSSVHIGRWPTDHSGRDGQRRPDPSA